MMKRKTAAQYCDLSEAAFEREIIAGRLPAGVMLGGRKHWCKNALDKALDEIRGKTWRKQLPLTTHINEIATAALGEPQ